MNDEIGELWPEIVWLEQNPPAGCEDFGRRVADILRQMATLIAELQDEVGEL